MELFDAISDPAQKCNFDLIIVEPNGEKVSLETVKVDVVEGSMFVTQVVTEKGGCLDFEGKVVRLRIYSNEPAVLLDIEYKLGRLQDASVSLDAHSPDVVELTLSYQSMFRGIIRNKTV